ncbi:MAG TPA: hypothetical protein VFY17_03950 [Pilimelia sp.]|nr:hypothetical protein [Pilimelia sp.]
MAVLTVIRLSEAALIWADRPLGGAVSRQLDAALQNLLDEGVSPLVIDLVRVSALDAGVVEALARAADDAGHLDLALHLRLPGGRRAVVRDEAELRHAIHQAYPRAA